MHRGKCKQNYSKIVTHQNECHQEDGWQEMSVQRRGEGSPPYLLEGMQVCAASKDFAMDFPQKIKVDYHMTYTTSDCVAM